MIKHAYSPTTIISDRESDFVSQVIQEVHEVFRFTLQHAETMHAQTIGIFERTHASVKKSLESEAGEWRSICNKYKYVNIAVLN